MDKKPATLVRFGVSMEAPLLQEFDELIHQKDYGTRSEAFRDLARASLVKESWPKGKSVIAVLSILYDHHHRNLIARLAHMEHDHGDIILSNQHVHLDHFNCLEVLTLRGKPQILQKFSNAVRALKGVKLGALTIVQSEKSS